VNLRYVSFIIKLLFYFIFLWHQSVDVLQEEDVIEPVKAGSQLASVPPMTVSASEADSARIYGSSYSGVSFGSGFSPDNLLLTDRRPVRSRSLLTVNNVSCYVAFLTPDHVCETLPFDLRRSDLTVIKTHLIDGWGLIAWDVETPYCAMDMLLFTYLLTYLYVFSCLCKLGCAA